MESVVWVVFWATLDKTTEYTKLEKQWHRLWDIPGHPEPATFWRVKNDVLNAFCELAPDVFDAQISEQLRNLVPLLRPLFKISRSYHDEIDRITKDLVADYDEDASIYSADLTPLMDDLNKLCSSFFEKYLRVVHEFIQGLEA